MNRTRRAVTVFLLVLAVALPATALPAPERTHSWGQGVLTALWARLAPVLGISAASRASADPNGGGTSSAQPGENPAAPTSDADSRAGADPNG
jgi:hypothetical protein